MSTSYLKTWTGDIDSRGEDSITEIYQVDCDAVQYSPYNVLFIGQTSGPHPLPQRRAEYGLGVGLYAKTFAIKPTSERRDVFDVDVTFSVPEPGEEDGGPPENPLLRPPIYNVEYIETEYVIAEAKNVEALSKGNGSGNNRPANTLGPIVNAAGKQPDEPLLDVERNAVLVIQKNYATLAQIVTLNENFQRTTNSTAFQGFAIRRLKYQLTESLGVQVENGFTFWPGVTRIEVKKTTDLKLDNVGYQEWNTGAGAFRPVKVEEPEPKALTLAGAFSTSGYTSITYRHLDAVDYSSLG